MIDLVMKFVSWIKDGISLIVGLPGMISSYLTVFSSALSWLPNGLGDIIVGFILTIVVFLVIYAIVKLVTSLL